MTELRRQTVAQGGSCPESELLVAFSEGQLPPSLREKIETHIGLCPQCAGICTRLANFDKSNAAEQDAEWVNTEKRLDNWIDGLLREHPTTAGAKLDDGRVRSMPRWYRNLKTALDRRLGWALVAILAVCISSYVLLTRHGAPGPGRQVVEDHAEGADRDSQAASPVNSPVAGSLSSPAATSPGTPSNRVGDEDKAASAALPPRSSEKLAAKTGSRPQSPPSAVDYPSSIRLVPSTYLLIQLNSPLPQDGTVAFQGSLQASTVPLDRGTEVSGRVTMKGGTVTSIFVSEIVIQKIHYKLQRPKAATDTEISETGWTTKTLVDSQLMLRLGSDAVYETSGGHGQRNYIAKDTSLFPAARRAPVPTLRGPH